LSRKCEGKKKDGGSQIRGKKSKNKKRLCEPKERRGTRTEKKNAGGGAIAHHSKNQNWAIGKGRVEPNAPGGAHPNFVQSLIRSEGDAGGHGTLETT